MLLFCYFELAGKLNKGLFYYRGVSYSKESMPIV